MTFLSSLQPFLHHFNELRLRLLRSLGVYAIAVCVCFHYAGTVLGWIIRPAGQLVFTSPGGGFAAVMTVTMVMAFLVSAPFIFYQIWAFTSGALRPRERRFIVIFAPLSFLFFCLGVAFAFFVAVPVSYQFLMGFASRYMTPLVTVDNYLSFVGNMVVAFGVTFELPLIMAFLAKIGIATPEFLRQKRRHAIMIILIVAALMTPPDIVSQIILTVPLIVLYEAGIIFTVMCQKKRAH